MKKSADRDSGESEYKPLGFVSKREFKEQPEVGKEKEKKREDSLYPEALPLFISSSL